jgi:hypothetical protein
MYKVNGRNRGVNNYLTVGALGVGWDNLTKVCI